MRQLPETAADPARVLIVDDQQANRELLSLMLSADGLLVDTAASGEEALALVARIPPDLILVDVMMPGMDGYQLTAALKADHSTQHIPVVMVTAINDRESRLRGLSAGAEEFIGKPVDRLDLSVRVRNLLRLKRYSDYVNDHSLTLEAEVVKRTADLTARTREAGENLARATLATAVARIGVWERNLDSDMVLWDATMFEIYGLPPLVPMPYASWAAVVVPEDLPAVAAMFEQAIATKERAAAEYRIVWPDGSTRSISAVVMVMLDEEARGNRLIGVDMDVTLRKRAEALLDQNRQEEMRFKDEFLSHVSHEPPT